MKFRKHDEKLGRFISSW